MRMDWEVGLVRVPRCCMAPGPLEPICWCQVLLGNLCCGTALSTYFVGTRKASLKPVRWSRRGGDLVLRLKQCDFLATVLESLTSWQTRKPSLKEGLRGTGKKHPWRLQGTEVYWSQDSLASQMLPTNPTRAKMLVREAMFQMLAIDQHAS